MIDTRALDSLDDEQNSYIVSEPYLSDLEQVRNARSPKLNMAEYANSYALYHDLHDFVVRVEYADLGRISNVVRAEKYWEAIYAIGRVARFLDELLSAESIAIENANSQLGQGRTVDQEPDDRS